MKTLMCVILTSMMVTEVYSQAELIFWYYDERLSLEELQTTNIEELKDRYAGLIIPLDEIENYYWDEQLLAMSHELFKEKYDHCLKEIYSNSDRGTLFFSVLINNEIVLSGLNRITPIIPAQMMPCDDLKVPRIRLLNFSLLEKRDKVYFQFTLKATIFESIWETPSYYGDINDLFISEIYGYFENEGKIIRGRADINNLDGLFRVLRVVPKNW